MIINPIHRIRYPNFTKYVRHTFPKFIHVDIVVKNVEKYGSLPKAEFHRVITWGKGPEIKITDLENGQCGVPQAHGCFRRCNPNTIEINLNTVREFENSTESCIGKTVKGQYVYVVGATLLHELCHWGNHYNQPFMPEAKEMGEEFELNTYGKLIS